MVTIAARIISRRPKQITLIAPLVAFLFSVGAGTSNILYPPLPVIYDLSYRNGVRPSRPLSLSVVATGVALACSPVSAAMAAMVTLTDVSPYDFELIDIIKITLPAAIIGIVLSSFVVNRLGKELRDDPEVQERIRSGQLEAAGAGGPGALKLESTTSGRNAALIFLAGVAAIVVFGLFKGIRPDAADGSPLGMTPIIEMIMFLVGTLILLVSRPDVSVVPAASVFRAGMVSAIALFGLAWLTDTFITAHSETITNTVGDWVHAAPWIFALGVFLVCVLTTSQSTATRTIVAIGLASGIAPRCAQRHVGRRLRRRVPVAHQRLPDRGRELRPLRHHQARDQARRPLVLPADHRPRGHHRRGGRRVGCAARWVRAAVGRTRT